MLIFIITLTLLSVLGVVTNLSVIVCIIKNASIRKSRNYLLIVSMTVADCFYLIIVSTQDLIKKSSKLPSSFQLPENSTECLIDVSGNWTEITDAWTEGSDNRTVGIAVRNILFRLFHYAAVASLVALNADKFYYIYAPFRYERRVTRTRLCLLIAIIWSFAIIWTLFEHFRYRL